MVQLLSEWMETFPYDFRDERVMAHVRQLTQRCVALDTSLRRDVSQMLHNLLHRLTALEKYEEFLEKINTEASANLIDTVAVVNTRFLPRWPLDGVGIPHINLVPLSFRMIDFPLPPSPPPLDGVGIPHQS